MGSNVQTYPVPVNPVSRRLEGVDLLRGLLMLLMAIDHTRDYFTSAPPSLDPTDPVHSWPALFATRWITHLCAPGFLALAGASVMLQRQRGKSVGQLRRLLLTRGLWLIFLELTVISFGWSFVIAPALLVIWSIGVSMLFLALLQGLSTRAIGLIGAAIIVLHNLLDPITVAPGSGWYVPWTLVHQPGVIFAGGHPVSAVRYAIVPWIGVIAVGYAFGAVVLMGAARRQRVSLALSAVLLCAFTMLRLLHGYGDTFVFHHEATPAGTAMSYFEVQKYPPSLQYLLATFGVLLLLYALLDNAAERDWLRPARGFVETFGRVPFFYYVLRIYALHTAALLLSAARGLNWHFWLQPGAVFLDHLSEWGYSLRGVYLAWLLLVLTLYLPCRWFAKVKATRRDWWLSYL